MSILIAVKGSLSQGDVRSQYNHVRDMALGNNSYPFRFGDLTTNDKYPLAEKLHHGHGHGYYLGGKENVVKKDKSPIYEKPLEQMIDHVPSDTKISLVHARYATQGGSDITNNHPIELSHIVGAHNGTVIGLSRGNRSDSHYILGVVNQYMSRQGNVDPRTLERVLIDNIVEPSSAYGGMNLIVHLKRKGKIIVLCSYGETVVPTRRGKEYYHMRIMKNGERVYIASEDDHKKVVPQGGIKRTENHTMYIIDEKTGKIEEHHLPKLKEAVNRKNKESKKKEKGKTGRQKTSSKSNRKAA